MDTKSIEARVIGVVQEVLKSDRSNITIASRIKDDLGADSLDQVSLIMALEDQLKVSISDSEAAAIITVGDAVKFIEQKAKVQTV
jgi:acyl carrier protein